MAVASTAASIAPLYPVTAGLAAAAAIGALAYGTFAPRSRLFGPVISRSPGRSPAVALTFDDGPWPGSTDAILDVLERERVRASFFVIGRYVGARADLIRRIHQQGHLIGNHTFDHSRLGMFRGSRYWLQQIRSTADAVAEITGARPCWFRPPMGFKSPIVMRAARACDHRVVTWTRRAFDGVATDAGAIIRNLRAARAGEILLLHDGRDPASRRTLGPTAAALQDVIAGLRRAGLGPVRLDELLGCDAAQSSSQRWGDRRA